MIGLLDAPLSVLQDAAVKFISLFLKDPRTDHPASKMTSLCLFRHFLFSGDLVFLRHPHIESLPGTTVTPPSPRGVEIGLKLGQDVMFQAFGFGVLPPPPYFQRPPPHVQ